MKKTKEVESNVTKFDYVMGYSLFEKIDLGVAEELLSEYNDFYLYNQAQYHEIATKAAVNDCVLGDEEEEEHCIVKAMPIAKETTDFFAKLFGSKDFAASTLVGLKVAWDDLQQILLTEFKDRTIITESALIPVAYQLRNLASILLFAEAIVLGMGKVKIPNDAAVEEVKAMFTQVLERQELPTVPEFSKEKKQLAKFKTVEQYVAYVKELLK